MSERTAYERIRDERGVVVEAIRHLWWQRRLGDLPRGDGHAVLVVPAYSVTDRGTWPLRRVLRRLGYDVHGWGLGANHGVTRETVDALRARLKQVHGHADGPVSLVGWSLGGVFARGLARHRPDLVRRVVTLGSPYVAIEAERGWESPPLPTTSVFSRSDALVDWRNASEQEDALSENVEVRSTHSGLALNPDVIEVVAGRLALPAAARQG